MKATQVMITSPFFGTRKLIFKSQAQSFRFIKEYNEHLNSREYSYLCKCLMCTSVDESEVIEPGIL